MVPSAARITISGVVQGVGFRPFIHRLARRHRLTGYVRNTSDGVDIHAEGDAADIRRFYSACSRQLPCLARIYGKNMKPASPLGLKEFSIRESAPGGSISTLVPADIAVCPECLKELFDPADRRYRYPFINCTNCGPRFSIIEGLPYDRSKTTMRGFKLCPACREEFRDIADRRYHAQPNACPVCGPQVRLIDAGGRELAAGEQALSATTRALLRGKIVAVKGISGYHIAVDAYNLAAVRLLRLRKHRPAKPFALMAADPESVNSLCLVNSRERELLLSPERPIVLLRKKKETRVSAALAPDNNCLGVMLCSAPLQYLLLRPHPGRAIRSPRLLVMTSANIADEPIEIDDQQCRSRLAGICDCFLTHNRPIRNRLDDSIAQVIDGRAVLLRRGRGYAPFPFNLDKPVKHTLACGAELKTTLCLAKNSFAFVSQYIGDLKTGPTFSFYTRTLRTMEKLMDIRPQLIAADLHPDYLSSRMAAEYRRGRASLVRVQHHHAHLASVIAEHRISGPVIGICMDGIGLGTDGRIWGGEFFTGDLKGFHRRGHLDYRIMPGADTATREPWRMAVSFLWHCYGNDTPALKLDLYKRHAADLPALLESMPYQAAYTSSAGRLFDAVSSLLGICDRISYEAQAAIRLQMFAERSRSRRSLPFVIREENGMLILDSSPMIRALVKGLRAGEQREDLARAFHNGFAEACSRVCHRLAGACATRRPAVCLSGGVFQNKLLLETLVKKVRAQLLKVYYNELLPANDGAISLGQALIANRQH